MNKIQLRISLAIILLVPLLGFTQTSTADSLTRRLPTLSDGPEKVAVLSELMKLSFNSDLEKTKNYGYQAASLSKKTKNDLALATVYKDLGVAHVITANYDSSWHYYQKAKYLFEKLAKRNGTADKSKVMEGYAGTIANMGNWYYSRSNFDSAAIFLKKGIELSDESGALKIKANALGSLAFIYLDQSKYDEALEMQLEALAAFESLDNKDGIARSYQSIGQIYCSYQKKCDLALEYYQKSLDIKKTLGNERGIAYVYMLIGDAYNDQNALDSAAHFYQKAIEIAEKTGDQRLLADGLSALSHIWSMEKNPHRQRLEVVQRLIKVAENAQYKQALNSAYSMLGTLYSESGEHEKSLASYKQIIPLAQEQKDYIFLQSTHYNIYKIYKENLNDPVQALAALEEYLVSHDSVTSSEKFSAVEEVSTRYETEKKEATIAQQEAALKQERTRFWLITGILVLALAGGALLFRLTRQLRLRNREKEFLIKEIHHRVKNNLQVLASLLSLQSRHIEDSAALDAVREGQNRVEAMGLIHQKLYTGDNLAAVEMRDYLHNLGDTLLDTFRMDDDRVKIIYHLEPLYLDVDTAIPLGLIINELLTNSLKYAFPNGRQGVVEISLWKNKKGKLCLKVADNGVGKNGAPELKNGTSFGTSLIEILSKKLKGTLQVSNGEGYATQIEFENFKMAKTA